jgi:Zn-dependent M16 (insulinase) family peptidase
MRLAIILLVAACSSKQTVTPSPPVSGPPPSTQSTLSLDALEQGKAVLGFTPITVYLDGQDRPLGARFVHANTGFVFDYLRIESAPQGFLYVTSFPTSDKGEPHTQEHLLLGKGDRGRKLGSAQAMALVEASAFTAQWRTVYHFHTVAGNDVYWQAFENQLHALLEPDYTDEEIRREVRNFGVDKAEDGKLHLEEKGTVYNEMVRSFENPANELWRKAGHLIYGTSHPLSYDSGGYPDAIREMTPADIRGFHAATHHLANMGMIGAFPAAMKLDIVLEKTGGLLDKLSGRKGRVMTEADLPKPVAAASGKIEVVEYPHSDPANPGSLMLAWPATRELPLGELLLANLFLDAVAGDETTPLYKQLVDGKTRKIDSGATSVSASINSEQGQPMFLSLSGVRADKIDPKTIGDVRTLVLAELDKISKLPDGDPELAALARRVQSRIVQQRRSLVKFLDSPPGFGIRGNYDAWIVHLHSLAKLPSFKKSLTMKAEVAGIEKLIAAGGNPWRERLERWGMLDVPYGVGAKPSPARRKQLDRERDQRIATELARLGKQYGTKDTATTLARYQADYDAETAKLEAAAKAVPLPPFVDAPPMTFDELPHDTRSVDGVTAFRAKIESMSSSRVEIAFRLDAVPEADLMYLAILPGLMSDVGVIDNGTPIPSDEMKERLRKEILRLSVYYAEGVRSGRNELVIAGAGNDVAETKLALAWMMRVMRAPDWRIENLPRIRDVVDQSLTGWRQAMLGAEEGWVDDPHNAWWLQDRPLHARTNAFLTQTHDLQRLRWQLLDPRDAKVTKEVTAFLTSLAGAAKLPRKDLMAIAAALGGNAKPAPAARQYLTAASRMSPAARILVKEAGKDLTAAITDLPDGSLAADWKYLCNQMRVDLTSGAATALAKLTSVREAIIAHGNARIVQLGSTPSLDAIAGELAGVVGKLERKAPVRQQYQPRRYIAERLREREPKATAPVFVALVNPATSSGVFLNSAPLAAYSAKTDDEVRDFLAGHLYTGHGAHSMFLKTWAAGLAYSNGVRPQATVDRLRYYAERCPLLPQTIKFVIEQLHQAKPDPNHARYAIAESFQSRIAQSYESRAREMAANLVDGLTPQVVRTFREKVLALSKRPDFAAVLAARKDEIHARVLPGYGKQLDPRGVYMVIGPAKQLDAYQDYLRSAVGKDATLHRLYPRDFWVPAKL